VKRILFVAALLAGACHPVPPPGGDSYDALCANLKTLGCPEGTAANCAERARKADQSGITYVPMTCLTSASSKIAVRACGFVECAP
jgi:hypothetical protein